MDEGERGFVLTSVANPTKTTQFTQYRGNTLTIRGSYGILYVDKARNPEGQEIDSAPFRGLGHETAADLLRPDYHHKHYIL